MSWRRKKLIKQEDVLTIFIPKLSQLPQRIVKGDLKKIVATPLQGANSPDAYTFLYKKDEWKQGESLECLRCKLLAQTGCSWRKSSSLYCLPKIYAHESMKSLAKICAVRSFFNIGNSFNRLSMKSSLFISSMIWKKTHQERRPATKRLHYLRSH